MVQVHFANAKCDLLHEMRAVRHEHPAGVLHPIHYQQSKIQDGSGLTDMAVALLITRPLDTNTTQKKLINMFTRQ